MKSDKSVNWFVRITAPWEHIELKYKEVLGWVDYVNSAIGYHHGAKTNKAHAHIVLTVRSEIQKQSLDVRFKKLFDVKGSDYSSKLWDGSLKAISYLYHDKAGKVEVNIPMTELQKTEVANLVVVYDEIVTTAKSKASYKCVDVVLDAIKVSGKTWTIREIATYIIKGVRGGQWHPPGNAMLERYIDEIRIKQGTDDESGAVVDAMVNNFLARYDKIY